MLNKNHLFLFFTKQQYPFGNFTVKSYFCKYKIKNYKVVFFIGIFSMNITYIILAIVYIFGLGTYAYNQRNNADDNDIAVLEKRITIKTDSSDNIYSDCFFYVSHVRIKTEKENKEKQYAIHCKITILPNKKYLVNSDWWSSYNQQLPDMTRPSPLI